MSELMNNEYGHCGECHEVHLTSKMVKIDGYLYCRACAAADNAALRAENAKLREALQLGQYLLTIPAIQDVKKSQIVLTGISPIADFEEQARRALESHV